MSRPSAEIIHHNVRTALLEDLGEAFADGDITAQLIPADAHSRAFVISREDCVFCGVAWFGETFHQLDRRITLDWQVADGERVSAGQTVCRLEGNARAIVSGERTALNFIQTLSATASLAARYAQQVEGTDCVVLDTRKTLPGLRQAQKYAVRCGGCENHRMGLYDAFLVKENHIHACGGIDSAVRQARRLHPERPVEVEVENLDELQQAITAGADRVLLDNFDTDRLPRALGLCRGKITTEVSGNVTLDNLAALAKTGVDYISTGALTKDIRAIDFSMRFDENFRSTG